MIIESTKVVESEFVSFLYIFASSSCTFSFSLWFLLVPPSNAFTSAECCNSSIPVVPILEFLHRFVFLLSFHDFFLSFLLFHSVRYFCHFVPTLIPFVSPPSLRLFHSVRYFLTFCSWFPSFRSKFCSCRFNSFIGLFSYSFRSSSSIRFVTSCFSFQVSSLTFPLLH